MSRDLTVGQNFVATDAKMLTVSRVIIGVTACDKKLQKGVKHAVLLARKNKIGKNCHKIDSMQSFQ
jgi:hypothetical protein